MSIKINTFNEYRDFLLNSFTFFDIKEINKNKNKIDFITKQLILLDKYVTLELEFKDLLFYYFQIFCNRNSYKLIKKEYWEDENVKDRIEMNFFAKLVEKTDIAKIYDSPSMSSPNLKYSMLFAAIHECIDEEDVEFIKLLSKNGADWNVKSCLGTTPINSLKEKIDENKKITSLLLSILEEVEAEKSSFNEIWTHVKKQCNISKENEINSNLEYSNIEFDEVGIDCLDVLQYNENEQDYLYLVNNFNENQKDLQNSQPSTSGYKPTSPKI